MKKYEYNAKMKAFLRDAGLCRICRKELYWTGLKDGIPTITIKSEGHVHHIDKNRKNNDLGNLLTVCSFCHLSVFHRKEMIK